MLHGSREAELLIHLILEDGNSAGRGTDRKSKFPSRLRPLAFRKEVGTHAVRKSSIFAAPSSSLPGHEIRETFKGARRGVLLLTCHSRGISPSHERANAKLSEKSTRSENPPTPLSPPLSPRVLTFTQATLSLHTRVRPLSHTHTARGACEVPRYIQAC